MGREEKPLNLIKGEALIRVSRVENIPEINKRACPFIRHLRVDKREPRGTFLSLGFKKLVK